MQKSDLGDREVMRLRERLEKMAPVLKTLPQGTQVACVQEGDELWLYNISKAFELVAGRAPKTVVNVAELATQIQPRDAEPASEDKALIDPGHAATVDLSYPVMLLDGGSDASGAHGRVIDGWHRIYRAAQLGIAELPAIALTAEEGALIRIELDAIQG